MSSEFEDRFIDDGDPEYASGIGSALDKIKVVYDMLLEDHEKRGYNDAYINHDLGNAEDNIRTLFVRISIQIDRIRLEYNDLIRKIDYQIGVRKKAAMDDLVEELLANKETINQHLEKLKSIEQDIERRTGMSEYVRSSYMRGFKRGLASISKDLIQ